MRGLLATAYAFGFALFMKLARRALRRSERHSARADWCSKRAAALDTTATKPAPGDHPQETTPMSEKPSEAPIKFPQASVVKALFVANNKAKEETASINGTYGDRIKTQIEVGNLHGPSFRHAASIFRKAQNNELKAKEHVAHLRFLLDLLDEEFENAGHTGDLDRMSKAAAAKDADEDADEEAGDDAEGGEPTLNDAPTANGGVPLGDALAQFEATGEVGKRRRAARKKLDLPEDGSAAVTAEAAPPPPPEDEGEADLRPAFLRLKDEERNAAVH